MDLAVLKYTIVKVRVNGIIVTLIVTFSALDSQASIKKNYTGKCKVDEICKVKSKPLLAFWFFQRGIDKENRINITEECTRKKCKTAILLYCFHTAGVLHIFMLFNLLGPGTSF